MLLVTIWFEHKFNSVPINSDPRLVKSAIGDGSTPKPLRSGDGSDLVVDLQTARAGSGAVRNLQVLVAPGRAGAVQEDAIGVEGAVVAEEKRD